MNTKTIDIILIILIFLLLVSIGILISKFDKDSFECMANPITYFENLKDASCKCEERSEWNDFVINLTGG